MDEVDVRADQLVMAIELLHAEHPVVDKEFEVERADISAGIAWAGGIADHQIDGAPEAHISVFEQLDEGLTLEEIVLKRVADHRVAGEARNDEGRFGVADEEIEQRRERLLGMIKFGGA